jgi:hypothetical protein
MVVEGSTAFLRWSPRLVERAYAGTPDRAHALFEVIPFKEELRGARQQSGTPRWQCDRPCVDHGRYQVAREILKEIVPGISRAAFV